MLTFRISPLCVYAAIATWFSHAAFLVPRNNAQSDNASSSNATTLDRIDSQKALAGKLSPRPLQALNNTMVNLHATNKSANDTQQELGGVVHFLFLIVNYIPHAEIWRQFFSNAPQGSWKAWVHCKNSWECHNYGVFSENPGFVQVPTTETFYCHDLVTAMKVLLENALLSQAGGQKGAREKFVFVSESTLPVKPFFEVSRVLLSDDNSDFCVFPSSQWAYAHIDGRERHLVKHHQWVTLNREHAQLFVDSWRPVEEKGNWPIYMRDNAYGLPLQTEPQEFGYPPQSSKCTDEWAFFANIYGALQPHSGNTLHKFGGGHLDMESKVTQGVCRTWSFWDHTWDAAATQLASQIANDFGSFITCYPKCWNRPAELEQLSDTAFHYLRHSPFLFVRKFSSVLHMPTYFDYVLKY